MEGEFFMLKHRIKARKNIDLTLDEILLGFNLDFLLDFNLKTTMECVCVCRFGQGREEREKKGLYTRVWDAVCGHE